MNLIFIYICILSQEVMLISQLLSLLHNYAIEIIHFVSVQPLSINRILLFQLLTSSLAKAICISVLKELNLSVCHILVFDNAESLILLNPLLIYPLQAKIENISG